MQNIEKSSLVEELPSLEFLWLELTNQCNLQCIHCYSESSPKSTANDILNINDYKRVMAEAYHLGCEQIQFIGGEPTLNKGLPVLIENASRIGYKLVEVFTNLVTLRSSLLDVLKKNQVSVATSFYSSKASVHDSITQLSGSFGRTSENIRKIIDAGLDLRVGVISMKENVEDIERTFEYLKGLGVHNIGRDHVREFGRAQQQAECSMDKLCGNCAGSVLAVGPDGIVAPCILSKRWAVGSVLKTPFSKLACSEKLSEIRRKIADATYKSEQMNCYPQCGPHNPGCGPNCNPMTQCNPCAPNGGHKCQPNNWCAPGQ